jgi:hypothetical protein
MTREERIHGSSPPSEGTRSEDKIDRRLIDLAWRAETESAARRSDRYVTALVADFAWLYVDQFAEWERHRGAEAARQ